MTAIVTAAGGIDNIVSKSGTPLTNLQALDLVAQNSAVGGGLAADFGSIGAAAAITTSEAALTTGYAVLQADVNTARSDSAKTGSVSPADAREILGDVLALGGDAGILASTFLNQDPETKPAALVIDGLGDDLTLAGIAINHWDYVTDVFSTDWNVIASAASSEINTLQSDLNAYTGAATSTIGSQWTTAEAAISGALGEVSNSINNISSNDFPSDASSASDSIINSETLLSGIYSGMGSTGEDVTETATDSGSTTTNSSGLTVDSDGISYDPNSNPIYSYANSDGSTTTYSYSTPSGATPFTTVDQENPDGSSEITDYNYDGSSVATFYKGPNGTGPVTETDTESPGGTSQITTYNSDGSSITTNYSGPSGSGSPVQSTVTVFSTPVYDSSTNMTTTYSATVTVSPIGLTFLPQRTDTFANTSQTIDVKFASGNLEYPGDFIQVEDGAGSTNFYGTNGVTPSVSVPDLPIGITTESNGAGDFENVHVPLEASYRGGVVDFSILASQKVYAPATAVLQVGGTPETAVNLGTFHLGDSVGPFDLTFANTATGALTDSLSGGGYTSGPFSSSTLNNVPSGGTGTIAVSLNTGTAGEFTAGSELFDFVSQDPDLPDEPLDRSGNEFQISATVQNFATAAVRGSQVGAGSETFTNTGDVWTLDFGTVTQFAYTGEEYDISIENVAPAMNSDWLDGSATTSGDAIFRAYSSIGVQYAGESGTLGDFVPDTLHLGANEATITLTLNSANDSGYSGVLPTETFIIRDNVVAACYLGGTRILTQNGEVRVEDLVLGDILQAQFADSASVKWIGHRRIDCSRHQKPQNVWPVRVAAGAFGEKIPHRDLWLSPDHAVYVDGVLIPIRCLMNGETIRQEERKEVTYWHIELEQHDVILAEGLPCESYLDTGNRAAFANCHSVVQLHPEFTSGIREARGCAPLVVAGDAVEAVRNRILDRVQFQCRQTEQGERRQYAA